MALALRFRCVAVLVFLLSSPSALPVVKVKAAALDLFTDKEALLSLKSQVTTDPSNTLFSWNNNSSPCNWTRVSCNQVNQRVVGLDLSGLRLTGSISPNIGNLPFLRSLHLQGNQFTGLIPDQLGVLSRLSVLNISFNSINGPIPLNITKCLNLQILDLMQNEISGAIPEELSSLKSLEILKLGLRKFPDECLRNQKVMALALRFRCVAVLVFLLSSPSALPVVKEALLSLKSHVTTDPSNTLFSWNNNSSPCNWTRVSCNQVNQRVVGLDLSGLRLTGSISPNIGNLSFLRSLHLQGNQFTGLVPDQIGALSRLSNEISGAIPEELSSLKSLEILKLGGNKLWGTIPPSFANITSLLTLNLATNNLGGMIPDDFGRFKNLKHLDLSINYLTGNVPLSLYNISSLVFLAVASNQLRGEIPVDVGDRLPNLLNFNFCINKFTGLGNLPELQMYNIGYNQIKSSGDEGLNFLTSFINSSYLNFLAIDGNLLEGLIPESIGNLSAIGVHGSIQQQAQRKHTERNFQSLQFECNSEPVSNQLTGSFASRDQGARNAAAVDFSHNHLSGSIPDTIGSWKSLEKLFMENNMFSGVIPGTLGDALHLLNLSFNDLEGLLPKEGAFINLSRIHVEGNSKLCLDLTCWNNQHRKRTSTAIYIVIASIATVAVCSVIAVLLCGMAVLVQSTKVKLGDGTVVAVKVLDIENIDVKGFQFVALVYDYMRNGSLEEWIKGSKRLLDGGLLNILERLNVAIDVACAVDYLHHDCEIPVVHCDFETNIEQVVDPELFTGKSPTHECLITILGVGLSCTVDSPDRRTNMRDSLLKLKTARDTLLNHRLTTNQILTWKLELAVAA
uniref:Leucine-rich repeat-containing N-terminal plant-type domain-containing protein n=1 Tax=Populus alba TaxID=43335 RepID=A0A4V6XX69_POPAL|nr:hypothetical protein D5086_0000039140 [Populus alba]